jgi:uncharacterized membrane protein
MDKPQIIAFIEGQLATGKITREDLVGLVGVATQGTQSMSSGTTPSMSVTPVAMPAATAETSNKLIQVLYIIGAVIVIIGAIILVAQNWNEIGFMGRILVTLGISLAAYIAGIVQRSSEHKVLSQIWFLISALLAPLGSYVLLSEASVDFTSTTQIITSAILAVIYGTALLVTKRNILVLITVAFATWTYYALLIKVFGVNYYDMDFIKWATMLLGVSYLLIAFGYSARGEDTEESRDKAPISNTMYGLGTLAVLGGGISIGGYFDMVLILMIFGSFYASVYLKSRMMLFVASVFLVGHIIKLTSKYFVNSIGWPVALIAVGLLVIGVGYVTFYLNKKFISSK